MSPPLLRFFLSPEVAARGVTFGVPRAGDAGFDLRSAESICVAPGAQLLLSTGLSIAVPSGYVAIVKDRSSMALQRIYTHAGVIDAGYRGEVKILLSNGGQEPYAVQVGDKVAQLLVVPCLTECAAVASVAELGGTERGAGGFGSTGKA